jgi:hypothetical protein
VVWRVLPGEKRVRQLRLLDCGRFRLPLQIDCLGRSSGLFKFGPQWHSAIHLSEQERSDTSGAEAS